MSHALSITLAIFAVVVYSSVQRYLALRKQIELAKATNIPYVVLRKYNSPSAGDTTLIPVAFSQIGRFWYALQKFVLPLYERIPGTKNRLTTKCVPFSA